jgi:hypothetical protein
MRGSGLVLVTLSLLVLVGGVLTSSTLAQAPGGPPAETFGPTTATAHTVSAQDFIVFTGIDATNGTSVNRYCFASPPCRWLTGLHLPAGALLTRIELDGCDAITNGEHQYRLLRQSAPGATSVVDLIGFPATGIAAQPGCARSSTNLPTPETIDNNNFTYVVEVIATEADVTLDFTAVRAFYTLQVSPAPGSATFGDVPTSHPFFQFVQALVASGITAGCGGGNYCPDQAVTRGQMAVFLSKALGLHFAP